VVRTSLVGLALGALVAAPLIAGGIAGLAPGALLQSGVAGLIAGVDLVGWVFVPQLVLGIAVLSLALQQIASRAAGLGAHPSPDWLDPAVESALLLGMLGTISGMVSGFTGLSPDELEPGPLVYSLGVALRSSFVGFLIALVGVWTKNRPPAAATGSA
jgi:hypothetical protein